MDETYIESCIFCDIIANNENIIIDKPDLIVIKDIKPQSTHHYLVISRKHIRDAKQLTSKDEELLLNMVNTGEEILRQKEADLKDAKYGFHWPPFTSVKHLHLHAISPASQMSFIGKVTFSPNTWWFATPEYVKSRIVDNNK